MQKMGTAQTRATDKWRKANKDIFNLRMPKGTKERIRATGMPVSAFINAAVEEKLKKEGK